MKNGNNHLGFPPNDFPHALNDFSGSKIKAPVQIGDNYTFNFAPPTKQNSLSASERQPEKTTKEKRISKKSKTTKIVLIGVGTISVLSIIAFVLMRCKEEITQEGLIAICEAISSMFSFFSLLFSK